jgi:hypothetical protein
MNDDEIKQMQKEIDTEKEEGLGLPVGVMNDVAQQQMMAQVPQQPMNHPDQEHEANMAKPSLQDTAKQSVKKEEVSGTLLKLKQIL